MNLDRFDIELYQNMPQIALGFHGCDEELGLRILNSRTEHLVPSNNPYDWLGKGIYFWLNDPQRAYEWAVEQHNRSPKKVKKPFVVGAIIDLGNCLNLCERESVLLLQRSYETLSLAMEMARVDIHEQYKNKAPDEGGVKLLRYLDCAVIENVHRMVGTDVFDSVYGYFQEGKDAYPNAGMKEKSHIQICIRNKACIKGYFLPREK